MDLNTFFELMKRQVLEYVISRFATGMEDVPISLVGVC
jgi:hypothetical protein